MPLTLPELLKPTHRVEDFTCGEALLDDWLKRRALANQLSGASRTFVVADETGAVQGFYALAAGAVSHQMAIAKIKRNMPDPVPVIVLARLAVAQSYHGRQIGPALLKDALRRVEHIADHAGVRAVLVHALHEEAKGFYEHYGFQPSPIHPMTLMIAVSDILAQKI